MGKLLLGFLVPLALVAACAATGGGPGGGPEPAAGDGRGLYEWACQRCHALYRPTTFEPSEWAFYVRKYGRRARLNRGQQEAVFAYLSGAAGGPPRKDLAKAGGGE